MQTSYTDFEWAQRTGADDRVAIGEDDSDFAPLPCCEVCGTEDGVHDDHGVLLCLLCSMKCVLEIEPAMVAFVGSLVARSAVRL